MHTIDIIAKEKHKQQLEKSKVVMISSNQNL